MIGNWYFYLLFTVKPLALIEKCLLQTAAYMYVDCAVYGDMLDVTREVDCRPAEFRCNDNRTCITRSKWCNRRRDCPDGSDELDCRMYSYFLSQFSSIYCSKVKIILLFYCT